eukprot:667118-Prorocentrum_minimum.AAC.6
MACKLIGVISLERSISQVRAILPAWAIYKCTIRSRHAKLLINFPSTLLRNSLTVHAAIQLSKLSACMWRAGPRTEAGAIGSGLRSALPGARPARAHVGAQRRRRPAGECSNTFRFFNSAQTPKPDGRTCVDKATLVPVSAVAAHAP